MLFNVIYIKRTLTIHHDNKHNDMFMLLVLTVLGFLVNWMNTWVCDVWGFCSFVIVLYFMSVLTNGFVYQNMNVVLYSVLFLFALFVSLVLLSNVCFICFTVVVVSIRGRLFFAGTILSLNMCFVCFSAVVLCRRDVGFFCFMGVIVFIRDVLYFSLSCCLVYRNAFYLFHFYCLSEYALCVSLVVFCLSYPGCAGLFHWISRICFVSQWLSCLSRMCFACFTGVVLLIQGVFCFTVVVLSIYYVFRLFHGCCFFLFWMCFVGVVSAIIIYFVFILCFSVYSAVCACFSGAVLSIRKRFACFPDAVLSFTVCLAVSAGTVLSIRLWFVDSFLVDTF